ncbi:MAG: acyl-CoA thioesterase [Burkholderiaceae bacterium]|nr:acyl-CoA thioesterase [Burkholderiaceae bacterium]
MNRTAVFPVAVNFGDCDPAGIVFYPNFLRWMDAASAHFFFSRGVPPWHELEKTQGIVGTPLLEVNVKFYKPATYPERIEVHTRVEEWREKVFIQHHAIRRGDDLLCEGRETRAFVKRDPDSGRLRAVPVPPEIRTLCE